MRLKRLRSKEQPWTSGIRASIPLRPLGGSPSPPVRDQLAVFSRARTSTDELSPEARGEIEALHADRARDEPLGLMADGPDRGERAFLDRVLRRQPQAAVPAEVLAELEALDRTLAEEEGDQILHDSRLLLKDLGGEHLRLYAIPTTTGQVWLYLVAPELQRLKGGWMVSALPDEVSWQLSFKRRPGQPTYLLVCGVVANEVAGVEVKLKRDTRSAALGNNGFFYEATGLEADEVVGLVLQRNTGESRAVSISKHELIRPASTSGRITQTLCPTFARREPAKPWTQEAFGSRLTHRGAWQTRESQLRLSYSATSRPRDNRGRDVYAVISVAPSRTGSNRTASKANRSRSHRARVVQADA